MKASELGELAAPGCYIVRPDTEIVVEGPLREEEAQHRCAWLEATHKLPVGFLQVKMVLAF